jgi:O-antigen/teichoic acid export membrane protein
VAATFAALASTFRDFGITEYLVQEHEVTAQVVRVAFGVNLVVSWLMAALLLVSSGWIGEFYGSAEMVSVMWVQAINFVLIPFGAITLAWYRRQLDFKPIFLASLISGVVSSVVAVGLAWRGAGVMSLAWSGLAGVAVTVLVALFFRPRWFPRLPSLRGASRVVHFGKFASGVYIFGQIGKSAPELVIGRAAGLASAGMFSRANGVVELFNRLVLAAFMPVALPYLADLRRSEGTVLPGMQRMTAVLTGVGWPFLGVLALAAYPAVRIMYGSQWIDAVPVAQVLCLVGIVELLFRPAKHAFFALGMAKEANTWQMVVQGLRVVGLLGVLHSGLMGASIGLLMGALLGAVFTQWYLGRHLGVTLADTLSGARVSGVVTGLALLPYVLLTLAMPVSEQNYLRHALMGVPMAVLAWLMAIRWLRHPLWPLIDAAARRMHAKLLR